jgi:hypothetical protein
MAHGGKRNGAGRRPKAEELELIERLSPLDEMAMKKLEEGLKAGEFQYIKMFFEYRFGKPKESISVKSSNTNIQKIILEDVDGTEI